VLRVRLVVRRLEQFQMTLMPCSLKSAAQSTSLLRKIGALLVHLQLIRSRS